MNTLHPLLRRAPSIANLLLAVNDDSSYIWKVTHGTINSCSCPIKRQTFWLFSQLETFGQTTLIRPKGAPLKWLIL